MELWAVVITALVSPLFLKLTEFVLNKSSQKERDAAQREKERDEKIKALGLRIDELRDANIKLTITSESQQQTIGRLERESASDKRTITEQSRQIIEQAQQIVELREEIGKRDGRILELENRVNILSSEGER